MTGIPLGGPTSAYPTFNTPASICFSAANGRRASELPPGKEDWVPVEPPFVALISPSCAALTVSVAVPKKLRRPISIVSLFLLIVLFLAWYFDAAALWWRIG
jgi:hypothetical protein